jgi:hypothetical protein
MSNDINILDPNAFFKISGNVHNIREREYNGTVTKYLMIEDNSNPEWPNFYEVEFYKDKANLVTGVNVGDFVTCNINFGGRKWEDKNTGEIKGCFFSLKGWKIEAANSSQQFQQGQHPQHQAPVYTPQPPQEAFKDIAPTTGANPEQIDIKDDDLPF